MMIGCARAAPLLARAALVGAHALARSSSSSSFLSPSPLALAPPTQTPFPPLRNKAPSHTSRRNSLTSKRGDCASPSLPAPAQKNRWRKKSVRHAAQSPPPPSPPPSTAKAESAAIAANAAAFVNACAKARAVATAAAAATAASAATDPAEDADADADADFSCVREAVVRHSTTHEELHHLLDTCVEGSSRRRYCAANLAEDETSGETPLQAAHRIARGDLAAELLLARARAVPVLSVWAHRRPFHVHLLRRGGRAAAATANRHW